MKYLFLLISIICIGITTPKESYGQICNLQVIGNDDNCLYTLKILSDFPGTANIFVVDEFFTEVFEGQRPVNQEFTIDLCNVAVAEFEIVVERSDGTTCMIFPNPTITTNCVFSINEDPFIQLAYLFRADPICDNPETLSHMYRLNLPTNACSSTTWRICYFDGCEDQDEILNLGELCFIAEEWTRVTISATSPPNTCCSFNGQYDFIVLGADNGFNNCWVCWSNLPCEYTDIPIVESDLSDCDPREREWCDFNFSISSNGAIQLNPEFECDAYNVDWVATACGQNVPLNISADQLSATPINGNIICDEIEVCVDYIGCGCEYHECVILPISSYQGGYDNGRNTGISKRQINDFNLHISPNPASNQVNIKLGNRDDAIQELSINDANGRLMTHQERLGNQAIIDVSDFPKGLYTITITDQNNQMHAKKLIVK